MRTDRPRLSLADGTQVAEVRSVSGRLDLGTRRLVTNQVELLRSPAGRPELLGL